jgi:flagellar M-ring protein FliF
MKDASGMYSKVEQKTLTHNEEINKKVIQEEKSPAIDRVTVSVNIDGTWKLKYDEKGKVVTGPDGSREREYTPLPAEEIAAAEKLIQGAIGYDVSKGYSVVVQNIRFDRTQEHGAEDAAFAHSRQLRMTILLLAAGLIILLMLAVGIRLISRSVEKRKRAEQERLAQQQEAMRASPISDESVEVSMSVEERQRMALQENAITMAKEHPGDVAQLIRTWLAEE